LAVTEPWYEKLNLQQKDLFKAIFTKKFKTDDSCKQTWDLHGYSDKDWDEIVNWLDDKTVLHLIFSLGPDVFKQSVIAGGLTKQSKIFFDIIDNAKSSIILNILMDKVEK